MERDQRRKEQSDTQTHTAIGECTHDIERVPMEVTQVQHAQFYVVASVVVLLRHALQVCRQLLHQRRILAVKVKEGEIVLSMLARVAKLNTNRRWKP